MSGTFYNLNTKYNWLLALFNSLPSAGDIMTLSTDQVATGEKTFNTLPKSTVVPVANDELTNKLYVDNIVSLPENVSLYPPLAVVPTSTAATITSMFRMRATIKSASFYKVNASICCLVAGVGTITNSSLSFSNVINPVLNLNDTNLLLSYANAVAAVPSGRNFTMSGTGVFTGADILNGLPDGLTVFYLNILTNNTVSPVLNPNNEGLMPTTFYFEEVSISL
jgi:hypothetical protein